MKREDKFSKLNISKQRRYDLRNPDKKRDNAKKYRQSPAYMAWLERTKEHRREYARAWRAKNPDYFKERNK